MRRIGLVFLAALAGCQSSVVPNSSAEPPAGVFQHAKVAASATLPAGTYLATVRPDLGAISYYSLSGSEARLIGEAYVRTGDCKMTSIDGANLDRQNGIDIPVSCPGGLGLMQVPAGRIGSVAPTRAIVTHFPADTEFFHGSIDARGDVAIGGYVFGQTRTLVHDVLVYGPNASGSARPLYRVPLRSRGCGSPTSKGPGKEWGTAEQLAFSDDGTLIVATLPVKCGPPYVERFLPGSARSAGWFTADDYAHPNRQREFFATSGNFVVAPHGELIFGAFFLRPGKNGDGIGSNGAVVYSPDASGYNPSPQRTFADSAETFGGKRDKQATVVGIDTAGNTYLSLGQANRRNDNLGGYNRLAVFGPGANRTDRALRTIKVPDWVLTFGNAIVDIKSAR